MLVCLFACLLVLVRRPGRRPCSICLTPFDFPAVDHAIEPRTCAWPSLSHNLRIETAFLSVFIDIDVAGDVPLSRCPFRGDQARPRASLGPWKRVTYSLVYQCQVLLHCGVLAGAACWLLSDGVQLKTVQVKNRGDDGTLLWVTTSGATHTCIFTSG